MHPEVSKARASVAALARCVKYGERTPDELRRAKDQLEQAKRNAWVDKVLAEAPPLTDEQRTQLAELLKPVRRSATGSGDLGGERTQPETEVPGHVHAAKRYRQGYNGTTTYSGSSGVATPAAARLRLHDRVPV